MSTVFCLVGGAVDTLSMMMLFQRNDDCCFVVQCRSAETEIQQTLEHHLLDWDNIFLISDVFVSLMNILGMWSNCS